MMSASALSAQIRAKKKKMMDEHSDAVKLSGIPEDATDIDTIRQMEPGEELSENTPAERDEQPTLSTLDAEQRAPQPHDESWEDPKQVNQPADGPVERRKARLRKSMGMGR